VNRLYWLVVKTRSSPDHKLEGVAGDIVIMHNPLVLGLTPSGHQTSKQPWDSL
jgi:hypothetical protein